MAKFGVLIYKSNQKKRREFSCVFKNHERRKKESTLI